MALFLSERVGPCNTVLIQIGYQCDFTSIVLFWRHRTKCAASQPKRQYRVEFIDSVIGNKLVSIVIAVSYLRRLRRCDSTVICGRGIAGGA